MNTLPTEEQHRHHWWDKYLSKVWRNRDFRTLWLSLTITHFGGQVTFLALPLTAAILLNASVYRLFPMLVAVPTDVCPSKNSTLLIEPTVTLALAVNVKLAGAVNV